MRGYLEAENAWTEQQTAHLADLRQTIFDEIKARTQETDLSVPDPPARLLVLRALLRGQGVRRLLPGPRRRRRLDPAAPGRGLHGGRAGAARRGGPARPQRSSPRGTSSSRWAPPRSASTTASSPTPPTPTATSATRCGSRTWRPASCCPTWSTGVLGGVTWSPDGRDLYYATVDESWRADQIWRHRIGTAQNDDELVHDETDGRFWVGVGRSRSDRFLVIAAGSKTTTELRYLDTADPDAGWQVLRRAPRGRGARDRARRDRRRDVFLVLHNATGPDFELATAPIAPTPIEDWRPLIAARPGGPAGGRRRLRRPRRRRAAQRRPDPAAHPRAGRRRCRRRLPRAVRRRGLHRRARRQPGLRPADACGWATPR